MFSPLVHAISSVAPVRDAEVPECLHELDRNLRRGLPSRERRAVSRPPPSHLDRTAEVCQLPRLADMAGGRRAPSRPGKRVAQAVPGGHAWWWGLAYGRHLEQELP